MRSAGPPEPCFSCGLRTPIQAAPATRHRREAIAILPLVKSEKNPTDLELLTAVHERVRDRFPEFDRDREERSTKIYVPLEIESVAEELDVDPDLVFGRLYYDLDNRHGYTQDDGAKVHLFALKVGQDKHCINVPYLSSVLADLQEKREKHLISVSISFLSLGIAVGSLAVSVAAYLGGSA